LLRTRITTETLLDCPFSRALLLLLLLLLLLPPLLLLLLLLLLLVAPMMVLVLLPSVLRSTLSSPLIRRLLHAWTSRPIDPQSCALQFSASSSPPPS
jgi:hypothetical protein